MAFDPFAVVEKYKSVVVQERVEKSKMLRAGKIDFFEYDCSAVSYGFCDIAFAKNYFVAFGQKFAENEFIEIFGAVYCLHNGKLGFTANQLT